METFQPVRAETTENYGNGSKEKERDIETNAHKTLVLYLYKYMQMVVHVCALCGLTHTSIQ